MAGTVGDVGDEIHVLPFLATQQAVNGVDEDTDDVDVLPLVEAADVVGVGNLSSMENHVDGTGMVLHVEPVAHVLALAIDGKGTAMADVVDEEGDELLGELEGAVVVGAVRDDGGHAVGVVEGTHEVVAAGLGSRIGAVGLVLEVLGEERGTIGDPSISP